MFEQTNCTYPPDYNTVKEGLWSPFYYTIEAWIMCNNWNSSGEELSYLIKKYRK